MIINVNPATVVNNADLVVEEGVKKFKGMKQFHLTLFLDGCLLFRQSTCSCKECNARWYLECTNDVRHGHWIQHDTKKQVKYLSVLLDVGTTFRCMRRDMAYSDISRKLSNLLRK